MFFAWYLNPYFNKGFSLVKVIPGLMAPPYGKDLAATASLFILVGGLGTAVGLLYTVVAAGLIYYYKKWRGTLIPPIERREAPRPAG